MPLTLDAGWVVEPFCHAPGFNIFDTCATDEREPMAPLSSAHAATICFNTFLMWYMNRHFLDGLANRLTQLGMLAPIASICLEKNPSVPDDDSWEATLIQALLVCYATQMVIFILSIPKGLAALPSTADNAIEHTTALTLGIFTLMGSHAALYTPPDAPDDTDDSTLIIYPFLTLLAYRSSEKPQGDNPEQIEQDKAHKAYTDLFVALTALLLCLYHYGPELLALMNDDSEEPGAELPACDDGDQPMACQA